MTPFASIAPALLFGLAANSDNLTVGMAYGVKRRRIEPVQNLLIAAVTTGMTLLALLAGRQVRAVLPAGAPDTVGGLLLIGLAVWSFWRERAKAERGYAAGGSGPRVRAGESLVLACVLSVNNIGLAIGEGMGEVGYGPAAVSIFGFSVGMLALGQAAGRNMVRLGRMHGLLRSPALGNVVLALAGLLMLAGY